jgi:DNA-binding IclR family transcriptional regulator
MATQLNGSVFKAFAILGLFSESRPEISVALAARELALSAVTAHRFVKTLERIGAVVPVARGRYRLGRLMADIGEQASLPFELGRTLQPVLDAIVRDLNEGAMATAFESDRVVVIARAASDRYLAMDVRVGQRLEAYNTAHGKLWLANLSQGTLDRYLDLVPRIMATPQTIAGRGDLLAAIAQVRRQGFATNQGESEADIRALAVPVLSGAGRMVTALSMFGPASRVSDAIMDDALVRLRAAAGRAARTLYGNAPLPNIRLIGGLARGAESGAPPC